MGDLLRMLNPLLSNFLNSGSKWHLQSQRDDWQDVRYASELAVSQMPVCYPTSEGIWWCSSSGARATVKINWLAPRSKAQTATNLNGTTKNPGGLPGEIKRVCWYRTSTLQENCTYTKIVLLEEFNILSVSAEQITKPLSGVQSPADVQAVRVYLIIIYSSTFRERKRKVGEGEREINWGVEKNKLGERG